MFFKKRNCCSSFFVWVLLSSSISSLCHAQSQGFAIDLHELQWGPPDLSDNGFPLGARSARQGVDPDTGGLIYYALFPAGTDYDLHWHTYDEYVVVVQGEISARLGEKDCDLSVGSYVMIPGKLNHSWTVPEGGEDAIVFVRRAGPKDFHFVEK